MTDPVIEAAQRAWDTTAELTTDLQYTVNPYAVAKAAAREMAKSVQELHRPEPGYAFHDDTPWTCCAECGDEWPCPTAKRVYPTEELER